MLYSSCKQLKLHTPPHYIHLTYTWQKTVFWNVSSVFRTDTVFQCLVNVFLSFYVLFSFRPAFVPRHTGLWWQGSPPQPCALEPQNTPPGGQRHSSAPPISHPPPHRPLELYLSRWWKLRWWAQPTPLRKQLTELSAVTHQPLHQLWPFPLSWLRPLCPQGWSVKWFGWCLTLWPLLSSLSHIAFCPMFCQRLSHAALVPYSTH